MYVVRCYDIGTGHVEIVREINTGICDGLDRALAEQLAEQMGVEDRSTDNVYYVARLNNPK